MRGRGGIRGRGGMRGMGVEQGKRADLVGRLPMLEISRGRITSFLCPSV